MSEKRDLWVPLGLVAAGIALLVSHITHLDGVVPTGILGCVLGVAGALASLPIRMRHGPGRLLTFGLGVLMLLIPLFPALDVTLATLVGWFVLGLAFLLPMRGIGEGLRRLLLGAAVLFALLGALAVFDVLPRPLTWLFVSGALFMAIQAIVSRPKPVEEVPEGPRVVVFGGSFDPFHKGHRALAESVLRTHDRLLVVVAGNAPHKFLGDDRQQDGHADEPEITPFHHRVAMTRLGVSGLPRTEVLEMEGRRRGPSYTVDTLEVLSRSYPPGTRLRVLLGADMYADFTTWHEWERILTFADLLVAARPGYTLADPQALVTRGAEAERMDAPEILVSSTRLRDMVARREDVHDMLRPTVQTYIDEHELYRA